MKDIKLNAGMVHTTNNRITVPLEMIWQPQEDITVYELALCLPYFYTHCAIMPYNIDKSLYHLRHFYIRDPNIQQ